MRSDQDILDLEHQVWSAVIEKDKTTLGGLFADGYLEVTEDGKRVGGTEVVEESPEVDEIEGYSMDSERVIWLGDGNAILSYHLVLRGSCRGERFTPEDRWATSIWTNQNGRWQCTFFQQTSYGPEKIRSADLMANEPV